MRVLVAPDCYTGTLSAAQAGQAIAVGWRRGAPHDTVEVLPLSDGGPGFLEVLAAARPGARLLPVIVDDPLGRPVAATVLLDGDTGYVESAQAAGLHLLGATERDPSRTSTTGVGQLIRAALDAGVGRVVVGCGGSATNDGGAGMLAALGLGGLPGRPGGGALGEVSRLDPSGLDARLRGLDLVVATDVDNRLLGPGGASAVYGPQKGASADDVQRLDAALGTWAGLVRRDLGPAGWPVDKATLAAGSGAAGGLGYALLVLGGRRESGVGEVARATGLAGRAAAAELVVTGEGSLDATSLRGKVVAGVAAAAAAAGVACLVLPGQSSVGRREAAAHGIDAVYPAADLAGSAEQARARPAHWLAATAERVARQWSRSD